MDIRRSVTLILFGALADTALTAACFRLHLNLATVTLLFVLSVVTQALHATLAGSVAAALIAAGFVDYFFIPPIFTWRIENPTDLIALVSFVMTALITSYLASRARRETRNAARRTNTLDLLCLVSQKLLSPNPTLDFPAYTLRVATEVFKLRSACFFDSQTAELILTGTSRELESRTRETYITGCDNEPGERIVTLCVREGTRVTGAIGFEDLRDANLAARSLAAVLVAAIHREHALRQAASASAESKAEAFRTVILDALAHEFKTPLAVILAASGGLQMSARLTGSEWDLATRIECEAIRLSELTSNLLSRNDADCARIDPEMEAVDVPNLVESTVRRLAQSYPQRRIQLCDDTRLRPCAQADADLLRLIVSQLVDNAVKYSEPESAIVVSLRVSGPRIEVRVRNTGSVIAPSDREMIFQRFYRGADQRHRAPGSGLGLYVARRIATAHGGTLTVETTGGTDTCTTFLLKLPLIERNIQYAGTATQPAGDR